MDCAHANFHAVGWVNTFLPGGGRLVMGEYLEASKEAAFEIGVFGLGYSMSPDSSFTLDGTPIDYPSVGTYTFTSKRRQSYCSRYDNVRKRCVQYRNKTVTSINSSTDYSVKDATKPLTAALLQEFGLKYHIIYHFSVDRFTFKIFQKI
jgi:hypothetical protein